MCVRSRSDMCQKSQLHNFERSFSSKKKFRRISQQQLRRVNQTVILERSALFIALASKGHQQRIRKVTFCFERSALPTNNFERSKSCFCSSKDHSVLRRIILFFEGSSICSKGHLISQPRMINIYLSHLFKLRKIQLFRRIQIWPPLLLHRKIHRRIHNRSKCLGLDRLQELKQESLGFCLFEVETEGVRNVKRAEILSWGLVLCFEERERRLRKVDGCTRL
ncbi:hypothetical protein HanRHA438_Chr00c02g0843421 [Helianthus annuus]|nr:hypothetical protein HanRHA438_Chr00c02g0843421 [Helianthus annuus]